MLAMERYWTGHPAQGMEYCQHAIAALEHLGEAELYSMPLASGWYAPSQPHCQRVARKAPGTVVRAKTKHHV